MGQTVGEKVVRKVVGAGSGEVGWAGARASMYSMPQAGLNMEPAVLEQREVAGTGRGMGEEGMRLQRGEMGECRGKAAAACLPTASYFILRQGDFFSYVKWRSGEGNSSLEIK